jgi:hypothetical protein
VSKGFVAVLRVRSSMSSALALHFAYYNFCKIHGTIKQTPAMASGITDHAWSICDLL